MDQPRAFVVAAGAVSLAVSLFAVGAAFSSDDDGGDSASGSTAAPAAPATAVATPAPAAEASDATAAPADSGAPTGTAQFAIEIAGFEFGPAEATVAVGTEVVWTNNDGMAHSIEFDGGEFETSPDLAQGDTFSVTFTEPGTYSYKCGIHPRMSGTIVVEG